MKGWGGDIKVGVVETIFEEEQAGGGGGGESGEEKEGEAVNSESVFSSPPLSPLSCPSSPDLDSVVEAWSLAMGKRPDVKIHVQGSCFHLHKSGYLKRQLTEVVQLTLSPPLKITAETFKQVAEFCYNLRLSVTPFNVAALRTAAESLEMSETTAGDGDPAVESLRQKTETYYRKFVAVNRDFASIVLRSCLPLLPEVEETAFFASRCLEVMMCFSPEEENGGAVGCAALDVIRAVRVEDFLVVVDSIRKRFTHSHDFLYSVIDLYFKVCDGKISEDQKTQICNSMDCKTISPQLLVQAVQNPRMPLRFVVQAMLTEQFNTICTTVAATRSSSFCHPSSRVESLPPPINPRNAHSLGAFLQHDASLHEVAQLKAAISTTTSRIHSLEKELSGMKKRLMESEMHRGVIDSGRSASFRFSKEISGGGAAKKIERCERGSISSDNLQFRAIAPASNAETGRLKKKNNLGTRLIKGLKSVFRVSNISSSGWKDSNTGGTGKEEADYLKGEEDDDVFKEVPSYPSDWTTVTDLNVSHSRARSMS